MSSLPNDKLTEQLAIDVQGLVKKFDGKMAVNNVDIAMPRGKIWGFLGPNDSGKTTTIRMICGLLKPTKGHGQCLGMDIIKQADQIKYQTGYMTQKFSFWQDLTIRENLQFVTRLYGLANANFVVEQALEDLGLTARQHQLAETLSGGWKQRLALAAVALHKPKLLLLDEPTAGVDPQARRDFWDQIDQLAANGVTVLVSTHYMDEAQRCDKIVYLANGQIVTQGSVNEIITASQLVCFALHGKNIREHLTTLAKDPNIEHATFYGSSIFISGTNEQALLNTIQNLQPRDLTFEKVTPSLDDAFIALMAKAGADGRKF